MNEYNLCSDLVFSSPILLTLAKFEMPISYSLSLPIVADAWQTGVWKGLFLGLPVSVAHILIWRTAFFDNWKLALFGVGGKCLGELLLIFSIILGWRNLFHLWYFLSPFLMFLSVSYIMFTTTFEKPQQFSTPFSPNFNQKTRTQYTIGFLAHLFLGITQQTYVCHRLSNIAFDWNDKVPFGSFFKTAQGYIDQTIPGTTFSFCFGLIAGYMLITIGWFYFGTFILDSFFSNLLKISEAPRYNVQQYENEVDIYGTTFYSWSLEFYLLRIKPIFRKVKPNVAFLTKIVIYGLTWSHVFHYPSQYISAEGFQLVSRYFDLNTINSEYEQQIPRKLDPSMRPFIEKMVKTQKKEVRSAIRNLPQFKEYEDQIYKKGGFIFGDRIYSQQLLTRFGPYAPIQKYGDRWGWGYHIPRSPTFEKRKRYPNPDITSSLEKVDFLHKLWFNVTSLDRKIIAFLDLTVTNIEEKFRLREEKFDRQTDRTKTESKESADNASPSPRGKLKRRSTTNEDLFIEDQISRGVVKKVTKKTAGVEYFSFLRTQREYFRQLKQSPRFRPSLNLTDTGASILQKVEEPQPVKKDEKLKDEDREQIKKARTTREIRAEKARKEFEERLKNPQFKAIEDRFNIWGLRKVITTFDGTDESTIELIDEDEDDEYMSEFDESVNMSSEDVKLFNIDNQVKTDLNKKININKDKNKSEEPKNETTAEDVIPESEKQIDYAIDEEDDELSDNDLEEEVIKKDGEKKEETPEERRRRLKKTEGYLLNRLSKQNLQILKTFPIRTQISYLPSRQLYPEIKRFQKKEINENKQVLYDFDFDTLKDSDHFTRQILLRQRKLQRKRKTVLSRIVKNKPRRRNMKKLTLFEVAFRKPIFAISLLDRTVGVDNPDFQIFNAYKSFKPYQRTSGLFLKDGYNKFELTTADDAPVRIRRLNAMDQEGFQEISEILAEEEELAKVAKEEEELRREGEEIETERKKILADKLAIPEFSSISQEYSISALAKITNLSREVFSKLFERDLNIVKYFRKRRAIHSLSELEFFRDKRKKLNLTNLNRSTDIVRPYISKYKPLTQKEIVKRINESPTFEVQTPLFKKSATIKNSSSFLGFKLVRNNKESFLSSSSSQIIGQQSKKTSLLRFNNTQISSDWNIWRTQSFPKIWQGLRQNIFSKNKNVNDFNMLKNRKALNKRINKIPPNRYGLFDGFDDDPKIQISKQPSFILSPRINQDSKTFDPTSKSYNPNDFIFIKGKDGKLSVRTRKDVSLDYNRDIHENKTSIKIGNIPLISIISYPPVPGMPEIENGVVQPVKIRYEYEIFSMNPKTQIQKRTNQILKYGVVKPLKFLSSKAYKASRFVSAKMFFTPQSAVSALYQSNPKKHKRVYFYNTALLFSDCYYTGKFLQLPLPGVQTDSSLNDRKSDFLNYWISRSSEAAVKPVLFKLFKKKKNGEIRPLLDNGFFDRSLDKPSDFESYKMLSSKISPFLEDKNFETERRYYTYHKSPLYRALLSYNVSQMLDHELPSTIFHDSLRKNETESIRQKMFIYYQTRHLNNLHDFENFSVDSSSLVFNGLDSFESNKIYDQNIRESQYIDPINLLKYNYDKSNNEVKPLDVNDQKSLKVDLEESFNPILDENVDNSIKDDVEQVDIVEDLENEEEPLEFFQKTSKNSLLQIPSMDSEANKSSTENLKISFKDEIEEEIYDDVDNNDLTAEEFELIDQLTDSYINDPTFTGKTSSKLSSGRDFEETVDGIREPQIHDILMGSFSKLFGYDADESDLMKTENLIGDNAFKPEQDSHSSHLRLDHRIEIPVPSFIRDKFDFSTKILKRRKQIENEKWLANSSNSMIKSQILTQLAKRESHITSKSKNAEIKLSDEVMANFKKLPKSYLKFLNIDKIKSELSSSKAPDAYSVSIEILVPKKLKRESKKRFIFDTLPFRTNPRNFLNKKVGLIQNSKGAPLRTLKIEKNDEGIKEFSTLKYINTIWKPSIFNGPNLRELPIQTTSLNGGIIPSRNRFFSRTIDTKNLWNLTGVVFSGEKYLYRSPGPYKLGPLSFEPNLGSQLLYDFAHDSDKTLLPFFEDFWAAKLRLATYDSWLNILPATSTDPLYLKARNTVLRLKQSQKIRIQRLAFEQKWYLQELIGRFTRTPLEMRQRANISKTKYLQTKQTLEFLKSYLNSFGVISIEDELKIASQDYELESDPSSIVSNSLTSVLQTDKRYKPWYHEEIQMPDHMNFLSYDPDASLMNSFLSQQDELFPDVFTDTIRFKTLKETKSVKQEYLVQMGNRRTRNLKPSNFQKALQ